MQEQLITFETAKLAKEKGYNIQGQTVFDLKNNNKIINFKDIAIQEFINDVETGYRDKALYYLKNGINRTDDNTDDGYYLLAPTQSLLQTWLREIHNIHIPIEESYNTETHQIKYYPCLFPFKDRFKEVEDNSRIYLGDVWKNKYEEALEIGLQEGLKLIP